MTPVGRRLAVKPSFPSFLCLFHGVFFRHLCMYIVASHPRQTMVWCVPVEGVFGVNCRSSFPSTDAVPVPCCFPPRLLPFHVLAAINQTCLFIPSHCSLVCVPRFLPSCTKSEGVQRVFLCFTSAVLSGNHILSPFGERGNFRTLNGKSVTIDRDVLTTGSGFKREVTAKMLSTPMEARALAVDCLVTPQ